LLVRQLNLIHERKHVAGFAVRADLPSPIWIAAIDKGNEQVHKAPAGGEQEDATDEPVDGQQ